MRLPTQPEEALTVMKAWGFRLVTMKGFTWHKKNRIKGNSAIGMGHLPALTPKIVYLPCVGVCLFDWMLRSVNTLPLREENTVPSL